MWIAWLIGVVLNAIVLLIWNLCRVSEDYHDFHRVPVNIIVAILYIILALTPILNLTFACIWLFCFFNAVYDYSDIKWRFPKWMTKKIQ